MKRMRIDQYVVIRFGIGIKNSTWFDYRFNLLGGLLLPSLLNQSDRDFHLIVVTDEDLPEEARLRLLSLLSDFGRFDVLSASRIYSISDPLMSKIRELSSFTGSPSTLITRIDDDDALDKDAISTSKETFFRKVGEVEQEPPNGIMAARSGYASFIEDMLLKETDSLGPPNSFGAPSAMLTTYGSPTSVLDPYSFPHNLCIEYAKKNGLEFDWFLSDRRLFLHTRHRHADSIIESEYQQAVSRPGGIRMSDEKLDRFGSSVEALKAVSYQLAFFESSPNFKSITNNPQQRVTSKVSSSLAELESLRAQHRRSISSDETAELSSEIQKKISEISELQKSLIKRRDLEK